jgi:sodium/proline symporter
MKNQAINGGHNPSQLIGPFFRFFSYFPNNYCNERKMDYSAYAFLSYMLILIGIALWSRRRNAAGLQAFFLADRRLSGFVVALSAVASGRSAWLLLGVTGMAFTQGFAAIWAILGYTLVEMWMFLKVAPALRQHTAENSDITIPDFLVSRFGDSHNALRTLAVVIIMVFMTAYVSAQFVGGGKAFSASFGLDQNTSILLTAVLVVAYTLVGGFLAVSLTDVMQAIFMLIALIIVPILALVDAGGIAAVAAHPNIASITTLLDPMALSLGMAIGYLGIGLGSPGSPHILVRYMSAKDDRQLKLAAITGTAWNLLMGLGAIAIGIVARVYFADVSALPGGDTEQIFPALAKIHLHPILFGITISAVVAAIMSTADSMLLVAASALVRDLGQNLPALHQRFTEKQWLNLSKYAIIAFSIIALVLGHVAEDLVFWLVLFAWSGLGASFGPVILLGLFWRRMNGKGAIAGLISGTLVTIVWKQTPALAALLYELIPAFLVATLAAIAAANFTQRSTENA